MKIALIIERANIALGGAERSIFELSTALFARGHNVHTLTAKGETNAKKIHILCPVGPGKRTGYRSFAAAVKKHLAENDYDIVHSALPFDFVDIYQPRGGTYAESIRQNAASYENKLIGSYKKLTALANYHRTTLLAAEKRLCRTSDGPIVAALSQYVADQFTNHYQLGPERLVVIQNGIRINKETDHPGAELLRSQIMTQLRIKQADQPVFFLFVANNFRLKGLAPLIRAMRIAAEKQTASPAYLIVTGRGKSAKYRRLAGKLNIDNRIIFLGPLRRIRNVLSIAHVAVLPTFYDPSSRFALEAIAAGKPVITTRLNGACELFTDVRHGGIIDSPTNISDIAEAISHFSDPRNIKTASDAIIEDNLAAEVSITTVAEKLESLYTSILEKRNSR